MPFVTRVEFEYMLRLVRQFDNVRLDILPAVRHGLILLGGGWRPRMREPYNVYHGNGLGLPLRYRDKLVGPHNHKPDDDLHGSN